MCEILTLYSGQYHVFRMANLLKKMQDNDRNDTVKLYYTKSNNSTLAKVEHISPDNVQTMYYTKAYTIYSINIGK